MRVEELQVQPNSVAENHVQLAVRPGMTFAVDWVLNNNYLSITIS